ncbi:cilia- and flagella-associated protein 45 [Chanos chanos]|uniref:Cilia- and flagella-associated protein 45 n=1 Tax=Chanos chanos TaxID=29144 RepID=A0A6J2ULV7_CHACN|nr:cilia- and flagella-associated protein 45 [Chanos chanos]
MECVGTQPFSPASTTVCRQVVYAKPGQHCCGNATYNPRRQICCDGHRYSREKDTECCGSQAYNRSSTNHVCCSGRLHALSADSSRKNFRCCGLLLTDPSKQECCSSGERALLYSAKPGFACCGDRYYNTSLWSCCLHRLTSKLVTGNYHPSEKVSQLQSLADLRMSGICKERVTVGRVESMALMQKERFIVLKDVVDIHVQKGKTKLTPQSLLSKSGNIRYGRYRMRAPTSEVDETLFGTPKQELIDISSCLSFQHPAREGDSDGRSQKTEKIRVITKDLIRDIRIPCKDPSGLSIILCPSEIERITTKSRIPTKEERESALESQRQAREAAMEAAEERKAHMRQADLSRQKNQGLSDLEAEARDRAQYLLERANAMRLEQEDEVKKLNELILGAQCHAIRDAQILEKQQILAELQEEERRLDAMMEVDRRRALEVQEEIDQLHKQQRIQGKMCILRQIEDRQEERMLKEEMKEQEGQQLLENLEKMQMEELEALERKREEQRRLQLEIQRINEDSLLAKEQKKEEERLADLRAMEYTRKKLEREAEYEAEQRRIKREKEKEVARLRALQERDRDHKAEQDEIRARRNQEAAEREWRRKEKEQIKKKLEEDEKLKAARLEQITHKEHLLAVEAGRERAEFERVLRAQLEFLTREKEKEESHKQKIMRHAEGVRQQVRERETQAIAQRRELFREGGRLDEEARNRRARLDEIKEQKLMELKAAGLPEKYCNEVERKIHALPSLVR